MLKFVNGKIKRAQKVVVYGPEGIGKSTLAAQFPGVIFIDTENGTSHMDVRRIEKPLTFEELIDVVKEVAVTPDICKTLVLDTADWGEQLLIEYVCRKYKQESIEGFGYGRGYTYLGEEFANLLKAFDKVIAAGINVVITAHAKMRKFEQPDEMGAYDRWEMKLSKQVAPLLKEWCDHLLFCNYQTFVVGTDKETKKAQGGKRVIYTTHHPAWDAKTRASLPEMVGLKYENIASILSSESKDDAEKVEADDLPAPDAVKPIDALRKMMAEANITDEQIQKVVASKGHYEADVSIDAYTDKFISGWLIKYWPQILKLANEDTAEQN